MKKINIAELLKDCPSGMELDCTMYEDVYFDYVDEFNIIHCYIQCEAYKTSLKFYQYGTPNSNTKAKCVIFPKGKTTWEGFVPPCQFKDGDVVATKNGFSIGIVKIGNGVQQSAYVATTGINNLSINISFRFERFATFEEKEKLFQAIKDNGYKWNPETKTLEKLPKFKVGDRIHNKYYKDYIYDIHDITDKGYRAKEIDADSPILILFGSQEDNYELVPNKFDITTLKPFDKVLVRVCDEDKWDGDFYMWYNNTQKEFPYYCVNSVWSHCIPFEGNEHLLGTTDDCDEYFKTWG